MSAFGLRGRSRSPGEADVLERSWGIGVCERCGATLILGEAVVVAGRERVCSACAAAPAVPVLSVERVAPGVAAILPPIGDRRLDEAA